MITYQERLWFKFMLKAGFNEPEEDKVFVPSMEAFIVGDASGYIEGSWDEVTEVDKEYLPSKAPVGYVTYAWTDQDTGIEYARTDYYRFIAVQSSSVPVFARFIDAFMNKAMDLIPTFPELGTITYRMGFPQKRYTINVPLASYGNRPTKSVLEDYYERTGDYNWQDRISNNGSSRNGKTGKGSNWLPLILGGAGTVTGGPLLGIAGFIVGQQLTKTQKPKPSPTSPQKTVTEEKAVVAGMIPRI